MFAEVRKNPFQSCFRHGISGYVVSDLILVSSGMTLSPVQNRMHKPISSLFPLSSTYRWLHVGLLTRLRLLFSFYFLYFSLLPSQNTLFCVGYHVDNDGLDGWIYNGGCALLPVDGHFAARRVTPHYSYPSYLILHPRLCPPTPNPVRWSLLGRITITLGIHNS